jgi:predicted MFS family arabinose efflux permease
MYQLSSARERGLLWLLALTQFTIIMDFMVMMPLGPQIMRAFVIGPALFATAVSAYAWCSGLSSLFAATYIDRFDRRTLLLTVYALFALSNLGCAAAPTFHWLLIARAFAGLTGGILGSIVLTIVSDVIPPARRGAATGTVMTSFSLAAIAGVPAGIMLGAKFGWSSPFYLLVGLSFLIWSAGVWLVPSIKMHLAKQSVPLSQVLPNLFALLREPRHIRAYALTFCMMISHMLVIPFISPILVANYGIIPKQIAWIYMAGGAATFFTSRIVGRMADRYGKHRVFRILVAFSMLPVLFITHLPSLPLLAVVAFFPIFMVAMSGRMIPMQALMTTVPEPERRGAFLSINSAIQSLGTGCGAWFGGLLLSTSVDGQIVGFGHNGWIAVGLAVVTLIWVGKVRPVSEPASLGLVS